MTDFNLSRSKGLSGAPSLPGDKSIAHRTAILAALATDESVLANYPTSADPQSTLSVLRQLGISFEDGPDGLVVRGGGIENFIAPSGPLDCGNSGTTMRLMAGVLAGCPFESTLIGDESLSVRPMARIAKPIQEMGATVTLQENLPPMTIRGGNLNSIEYTLPVASAQVKSCVLLAGLSFSEPTTVIEPIQTRDHTERMLGLNVFQMGESRIISVSSADRPTGQTWVVPKDFSAAAFFLVAGTIVPNSMLVLEGVGINPSRTGLIDVLRGMGAELTIVSERSFARETIADIGVESSELHGITVPSDLIANIIDEIPILAVAATQARGTTVVRGASELRVKETDRIHATVQNLQALGANITEFDDGFEITGPTALKGCSLESFGDHRIAMSAAVAGLIAKGKTTVIDGGCAAVSFPNFIDELNKISMLG